MPTDPQQPEISIVVPVYCSAAILPELARRIRASFDDSGLHYEVIFADDRSNDNSWEVIQALCRNDDRFSGFRNDQNLGQPYNSLKGISLAKGRFIATIDDDLEYEPSDILLLYKHIVQSEHDVVFGLPAEKYSKKGKSPAIVNARNRVLNYIWNKPVTDSFKIFRREVVFSDEGIFLPRVHFEGYIRDHVARDKIGYVSVSFNERFAGQSNYTLMRKLRMFFQMDKGFRAKK